MPAYRTYITGLDDALKCFDRAPSNLLKVVKQALRDGGKQAAKEIRKAMPRRFKRLVACKVVKGSVSGDWSALVGAFNKAKSGTNEPDDWFKAYWKNYGTLTHRDKSHKFDYPVKHLNRKRRNEVGQHKKTNSKKDDRIPAHQARGHAQGARHQSRPFRGRD